MARTVRGDRGAYRVKSLITWEDGREHLEYFGPYATEQAAKGIKTSKENSFQRWSRGASTIKVEVQTVKDPEWVTI